MKTLLCLIFATTFAVPFGDCLENGWKGIKVLQTSRSEVEERLGKPTELINKFEVRYRTKGEIIDLLYSGEPCSNSKTIVGGFNVKKDTVLEYSVTPIASLPLRDIDWNQKIYVRILDFHLLNMVRYVNDRDGILMDTELVEGGKSENVHGIYFNRSKENAQKYGCNSK